MKIDKKNILNLTLKAIVLSFFGIGIMWRCANPMSPQGGPMDSLPPKVVRMFPDYGATNVTAKRIFIEFDEYIKMKDQFKEFFTSPVFKTTPTITMRGKGIFIDIKDTLPENTTIALNFGSSITDNNEGNVLNGFRYVFSTGNKVDSMMMSGITFDAYTKDSTSKAFIFFYDASRDTLNKGYDSLLLKHTKPDVLGRGYNNGIFITQNLKPIDYRVYAVLDNNNNQLYDPGVDKVGFMDSLYNPKDLPEFRIWFDTSRRYHVADPQILIRTFMDKGFKRQVLSKAERPSQHQIKLMFGAPHPIIEKLTLEGIDSTQLITEYLTKGRDTINLWINKPSIDLPDTIKGEITFLKHDSVRVLHQVTEQLKLAWRAPVETKEERKEREKREKDSLPEPNPFKYKAELTGGSVNPEKHIPISFEYPLRSIDSTRITLIRTSEDDKKYKVRLRIEQDTADIHKWIFKAAWQPKQLYELTIPSGVFENVFGEKNDSLSSKFSVATPDDFATIVLNVKGKTPESEYVIQIIGPDKNIIQERGNVKTGLHTFTYITPGSVRIRVIEDMNCNGQWDPGDLVKRIQPERVEAFLNDAGEEDLATKANWELKYDMDMNGLFGPVTMESVMKYLQQMEDARMRKLIEEAKEREKKKKQEKKQPTSTNSSGMGGMGMGGMGGGNMPFNPMNR